MRRSLPVVLFSLLLASACSPSREAGTDAEGGAPPSDLTFLFGRDGGGQIQGHSILADGAVRRWTGKYPEEHVQAEGHLGPDRIAALWAHAREADVFSMQRQDMAATLYFVTVTADGDSRRIAWHVPLGETPPDTPIQGLYDDLLETARAALDTTP